MNDIGAFHIVKTDEHVYWAEKSDGLITIYRRSSFTEDGSEILIRCSPDTLRNILVWADGDKNVTFSLTGPLAQQVREMSRELSLTPELFVWHAVKVFIDTGT